MRRAPFPVALAVALALAGCAGSNSFYPSAPALGALPSGYMSVRLSTAGQLDFDAKQYNVLFNTSGNGVTPSCGRDARWSAYSYALIAGGNGTATATPAAFAHAGTSAPAMRPLVASARQFLFNPNADGLGSDYQIVFARKLFGAASPKQPWLFNVMVTQPNLHDAHYAVLSTLGSCAACFVSPKLDVTRRFDLVEYAKTGPSSNPQIVKIEIANNP